MKNRIVFLFLLFFGCMSLGKAQTFEPVVQVKSNINNKDVMIDHATGTFHYKIPLFELTSGDFKLPISLNYSTQGVKRKNRDQTGNVGLGWNLDVGGVVACMIRGGDSESDIFTAVFNGRTLQFLDVTTPLERTNVKINRNGRGWIVTDENGVRYVYEEVETVNIKYGGVAVSNDEFWDKNRESAWYLTRIDIPNANSIYFEYDIWDRKYPNAGYGFNSIRWTSQGVLYHYGKPIIEHTYGEGSRARETLDYWLIRLENYLDGFQKECLEETQYDISITGKIYKNPYWDVAQNQIKYTNQVIGILSDYNFMAENALNMISFLYEIKSGLPYNSYGIGHAESAISCLESMLRETREVHERSVYTDQYYETNSPLLTRIRCGDKIITFSNHGNDGSFTGGGLPRGKVGFLSSVSLCDYNDKLLSTIALSYYDGSLTKVTWKDKNEQESRHCKFGYYKFPNSRWSDSWGYWTEADGIFNFWGNEPSEEGVKNYSLARINTSGGTEIRVDYELNTCGEYKVNNDVSRGVFGGLRLKSIVTETLDGSLDSVTYRYPRQGVFVYDSLRIYDILDYGGVEDRLTYDSYQYPTNLVANTGNNGLYYPYVEEEIARKGTNTYSFMAPKSSGNIYSFWLHGLPLAQASYDASGKLVYLSRNKYLADSRWLALDAGERAWLEDAPEEFLQKECLEYFEYKWINEEEVLEQYQKQADEVEHSPLSSYIDVWHLYRENIECRLRPTNVGDSDYSIYLGGTTALRERKEYLFDGSVTGGPSETHLTGAIPPGAIPVSDTRFEYDHPAQSVSPTRVIEKLANGDERITIRHTAADFKEGSDPVIDSMKARNIVGPVLRESSYLKKSGTSTYSLTRENINLYSEHPTGGGKSTLLPVKTLVYPVTGDPVTLPVAGSGDNRQTQLFTRVQSDYREIARVTHTCDSILYFPVRQESPGSVKSSVFERSGTKLLLEAEGCEPAGLDALDTYMQDHGDSIVYITNLRAKLQQLLHFKVVVIPRFREYIEAYPDDRDSHYLEYYESGKLDSLDHFVDAIIQSLIRFDYVNDDIEISYYTPIASNPLEGWKLLSRNREYIRENDMYTCYEIVWFGLLEVHFSQSSDELGAILEEFLYIDEHAFWRSWRMFHERELGCNPPSEGIPALPVKPSLKKSLTVPPPAGSFTHRVSLFTRPESSSLTVTTRVHRGASVSPVETEVTGLVAGKWQLVTFEVAAGAGVTSLETVLPVTGKIASAVMVPSGVPYAAYAYNSDGTLFCKFDHAGQVERYEYDAARRLTRVYDGKGNVLTEKEYNIVIR